MRDKDVWRLAADRTRRFDAAADAYDRHRPGYPVSLVDALVSLLPARARILEVGPGTGIFTAPLAEHGFRITGAEPGETLSTFARHRLAAYPDVEIVGDRFEDLAVAPGSVDAIVAADSWHWVEFEAGPRIAADRLRAGGWLAIVWHVLRRFRPVALLDELGAAWEAAAPGTSREIENIGDEGRAWLAPIEESGWFEPVETRHFPYERVIDGRSFADELATHAWVLALERPTRERLLAATERVIDARRGPVVRADEAVLHLARRRADRPSDGLV